MRKLILRERDYLVWLMKLSRHAVMAGLLAQPRGEAIEILGPANYQSSLIG